MTSYQSIDQSANRKNLRVLLNLRGVAFCAQVAAILTCYFLLNIVLPVSLMVLTASALLLFNLYSLYRLRSGKPIDNRDLFAGLMVDVLVLTIQLHFSNGTYNPFVSFFMLPVIIGAVMLDAAYAWAIYGLTLVCYVGLAVAGLVQPMPKLMDMPGMDMSGHPVPGLIDRSNLHMNGMMLGYAICAGVLVFMIARVRANLKVRDAEVQAMKASAIEEGHFVRMGLLSAGAAHELGTPLTTLSVILKDLIDLPLPRKKADLLADFLTMDAQVNRCKSIVSDILTSSGEVRGEGAKVMPLNDFLAEIATGWHSIHPEAVLNLSLDLPNVAVVADRVIAQVIFNVLDNAQEAVASAGQTGVNLSAMVEAHTLSVLVSDKGPGFSMDILSRLGEPYVSTKTLSSNGHGRGMGLFLVSNALRKLDGSFKAGNTLNADKSVDGAAVHISLPLASIRVEADRGVHQN